MSFPKSNSPLVGIDPASIPGNAEDIPNISLLPGKTISKVQKQLVYLRSLSETGRKGLSSKRAGVTRQTVSLWRKEDPIFNKLEEEVFRPYCKTGE